MAHLPEPALQQAMSLLSTRPDQRQLVEAHRLVVASAQAGDVQAQILASTMSANGTGCSVDWLAAVEWISAAAQFSDTAAETSALLTAMDIDNHGWPLATYPVTILHSDPRIAVLPHFLSPAESRHLAMSAADLLSPSTVFNPTTGRQQQHPIRTSSAAIIAPTRESIVIAAILRRIARVSGSALAQGESISLLHYSPGQHFGPHVDAIVGERNQRIQSCIIYLNDAYDGGEIVFPVIGLRYKPKAGDAVLINNVNNDGQADERSMHQSTAVKRGSKWVATRWIRRYDFDPWKVEK